MKTPHFTTDPIINRLLCRYDIDDYVVIVQFTETYAIPEPYLSNLKGNPWICTEWINQDMEDILEVTEEDLGMVRDIIAEHGFNCAIVKFSEPLSPNFYRNSAN